jgi:putative transposase
VGKHKGWYSRRNLPHFDGSDTNQFITFRLADSLPQEFLEKLEEELKLLEKDVEVERVLRIEKYLDRNYGSCILRESACAKIVQDALIFLSEKRFTLHAWAVMPNHVHFLARFNEGQTLAEGLHSLKSYTSNKIKEIHPEMGSIWQAGYFDRFMRNEEHFWRTYRYIHNNPVESRLCQNPEDFRWSSAFEEPI